MSLKNILYRGFILEFFCGFSIIEIFYGFDDESGRMTRDKERC